MRCRLDADSLARAARWVASAVPARPATPVLGGMLLRVDGGTLSLSGFDHDVTSRADLELADAEPGVALVPGQLFARIVAALPRQRVSVDVDGSSVVVSCAAARFTVPLLPAADFPAPAAPPPLVGTVDAAAFATEVARVAVAAGRDDTIPVLASIRLELDDELTVVAIDRYRLAIGRLPWQPHTATRGTAVLAPARVVAAVARGLGDAGQVGIAVDADRPTGVMFCGAGRRRAARTVDSAYIAYRKIIPESFDATVDVAAAALVAAVDRVALVAEIQTPVRLAVTADGAAVSAGGAGADATERVPATLTGDDVDLAVNPRYLLDGLKAIGADTVTLSIAGPNRPMVISAPTTPYTYTLSPVRTARTPIG